MSKGLFSDRPDVLKIVALLEGEDHVFLEVPFQEAWHSGCYANCLSEIIVLDILIF